MYVSKVFLLIIRVAIRKVMLDRGLISWLVIDYLGKDGMKMYGLEYSTALLMNLCLHRTGKDQCVSIAPTVLEVLVKLISKDLKPVSIFRIFILSSDFPRSILM